MLPAFTIHHRPGVMTLQTATAIRQACQRAAEMVIDDLHLREDVPFSFYFIPWNADFGRTIFDLRIVVEVDKDTAVPWNQFGSRLRSELSRVLDKHLSYDIRPEVVEWRYKHETDRELRDTAANWAKALYSGNTKVQASLLPAEGLMTRSEFEVYVRHCIEIYGH